MAKIGYIMTTPGYNDYEADVKKQIANIELTCGHTRGSLGPRKKKEDAE